MMGHGGERGRQDQEKRKRSERSKRGVYSLGENSEDSATATPTKKKAEPKS